MKEKQSWIYSDSFIKRSISIYLHWIVGTLIFWAILIIAYAVVKVILIFFGI